MIYILLITLVALLFVELKQRKSFVAPSVILILSFLMASSLIFINLKNWDVVLHFRFLAYVFTAVISFLMSTHLTQLFWSSSKNKTKNIEYYQRISSPSKLMFIIITAAFALYVIFYIKRVGFSVNLKNLLVQTYSMNVNNNGNSGGVLDTQMLKIITAIAYISFYQFLLAKYVVKSRISQFINYFNIFIFAVTAALSTDRNILLRFFIYAFVLWILFFAESNQNILKNINFKIIRNSIVFGLIALGTFYIFGQMKGYTSNFQRVVGLYGGSGLYNFNIYLDKFPSVSLQWGSETFKVFNSTLSTFLGNQSSSITIFDEKIIYKTSTGFAYISNIYSSLRPFLLDFGYFGMIIYPLSLGVIFENLYSWSQKSLYSLSWIIYAGAIYPIFYFSISDQFFSRLHLGSFYELFWLLIFYFYIQRRIKFIVRK